MPSNRAWVKPALAASWPHHSAARLRQLVFNNGSQPSHLSSSSPVQSEGSPRHRRAILLPALPSFERRLHCLRERRRDSQRGNWTPVFVLTAVLPFASRPDGAESKASAKSLTPSFRSLPVTSFMEIPTLPGLTWFCQQRRNRFQRAPYAVIAEGVHGGRRNGVDRIGTDQLFNVQHIAIFWILGAGAGPEQPLCLRALCGQRFPARASIIFW